MRQVRAQRFCARLRLGWLLVVAALTLAGALQACSNSESRQKDDADVGLSDGGLSDRISPDDSQTPGADSDQADQRGGKPDAALDGDSGQAGSTIGPEGGEISLPGGGGLSIPPGALAEPVEIIVSEVEAPSGSSFIAVGPFHSFAPQGLVFAVPATLTVPFDLGNVEAAPEDVTVVWSTDTGAFEPLATDLDLAAGSVSAAVTHFSEGGPAVFPNPGLVCCVDSVAGAFAEFLPPADCAAEGGEPSVAGENDCMSVCCSGGDGPLPALTARFLCAFHGGEEAAATQCEQTCCVVSTGSGVLASVMSTASCALKNGVAMGAPSQCAAACCGGFDVMGSPSAHFAPLSLCALSGLEPQEDDACSKVCCLSQAGTATVASVLSSFACTAAGGTVMADESKCEEVCCALGLFETTGVQTLARAECELVGQEVPKDACSQVCCTAGEGDSDLASVVTKWSCDQLGGGVQPPAQCEAVCCSLPYSIPDPSAVMPKILCDKVGNAIEMDQCAEVCCLQSPVTSALDVSILSKAQCEAEGGESAGPPGKCSQACCMVADGGSSVAVTVPEVVCELAGGGLVDPQVCAVVCCFLPSGTATLVSAEECEAIGGEVVGSSPECELVCCGAYLPILEMSMVVQVPKSLCPPDNVLDSASCQDVCCLTKAGELELPAKKMMAAACAEAGGKPAASLSACDEVCCGLYNPMLDMSFGVEIPRATCEAAGGVEADAAECKSVCCLVSGDSSEAAVMSESDCTQAGQVLGEPGLCEMICCEVYVPLFEETVVAQVPKGLCDQAGTPLLPKDCKKVCCMVTNGTDASGVVLPAKMCIDGGGAVVGAPDQCQSVCCLGAAFGFDASVVVPAAACTPPLEAAPASECSEVCCVVGSGVDVTSFLTTKAGCGEAGGTAFDEAADCALVCCGLYDPILDLSAATLLPKATCTEWGTLVEPALCTQTCCKSGDDVKLVPAGLCNQGAGVPDADCKTVCCKTGAPKPASMTGWKCASKGGTPTAQWECYSAMTGCKGDGDCISMDPCKTAKCDPGTGKCQYANAPDGKPCGAWDPCLEGAECVGGVCVPQPLDCDDGNPCTYDWCGDGGNCKHTGKQGAFCTGGPCVGTGICDANDQCQPAATPCSTPPPCHVGPGTCDPVTGTCSYKPDDSLVCFDKDACSKEDHCEAGKCVGTPSGLCPIPCDEVYDCTLKGKWHCDGGNVVSSQCQDGVCKKVVVEDCQAAGKVCFGILEDLKPPACFPPDWVQCWTDADCPYGGENYCVEDPVTWFIEKYECKQGNLPGCMPVQLKPCQMSFGTTCADGLCVMDKHDCCVADPYLMTKCSDEVCTKLVGSMRRECTGFGMQPWGWSAECAELAKKHCDVCGGTPPPKGDCCKPEGTKGCNVADCEYVICTQYLPACCQAWTQDCVDLAKTFWQCPTCP